MSRLFGFLIAIAIAASPQQAEKTDDGAVDAGQIRALLGDLAAEDDTVSRAAYQQLVEIGKPATPFLAEALSDPRKSVRWHAAQALGAIGGPEVIQPLLAALADNDRDVRRYAAVFLGKWGDRDPDVIHALNAALHDSEPVVIHDVVSTLEELGHTQYRKDNRLVDSMCEKLRSREGECREYAAVVLGMIGSKRACSPLVEALADRGSTGRSRTTIANALAAIGSRDAVPLLLDLLISDEHEAAVRASAAEALRGLADPSINDAVLALTESTDQSFRVTAVTALGFAGNVRAVERLATMVVDGNEDRSTRETAARSLGRIGDPRAVDGLVVALSDRDEFVRREVACALGRIGSPRAVPALIDVLDGSSLQLAMKATTALGEIQDERAAMAILELLDRQDALQVVATHPKYCTLASVAHRALVSMYEDKTVTPKADAITTDQELVQVREAWRKVIAQVVGQK